MRIVLVSDRAPAEVLPAIDGLLLDVKTVELSVGAVGDVRALEGRAIVVDAAENPGQGHAVLRALDEHRPEVPIVVVLERRDLERFSWEALADELLFPAAAGSEIRLRLGMVRRRLRSSDDATIRLGALALDTDAYRATVDGRPLDLTFKEFELLRYLAEHRGRVWTRPSARGRSCWSGRSTCTSRRSAASSAGRN